MKKQVIQVLKTLRLYEPAMQHYQRLRYRVKYTWKNRAPSGQGYQCNLCQTSYFRFVGYYPPAQDKDATDRYNIITGYGENRLCPNCMSDSRTRLLAAIITNELSVRNKEILQLAPEKQLLTLLRKNGAVVTTTDFNPERYRSIDKHVQFANILELPFANNRFDIVVANHVLEHIPDDRKAMSELFRVLKPNGTAILQIPFSTVIPSTLEDPTVQEPQERSARFGQHDHVRIYALNDYVTRLQSVGFHVVVQSTENLKKYQRYATQSEEVFFQITKP